MRTHLNIEFARPNGQALLLDVYLPERKSGNWPVVVWLYGGGWRGGSKDNAKGLSFPLHGMVLVATTYRLTPGAIWPAQIHDCKATVRWIRANANEFGFDPDRIGVWGHSAGGHLAAMLGVTNGDARFEGDLGNGDHSSDVHAVCNGSGPTDLIKIRDPDWACPRQNVMVEVAEALAGGKMDERLDVLRQASPVTHIKPGCVPFLTIQGGRDDVVHMNHARPFHEAMLRCGNKSELLMLPEAGHSVYTPEREVLIREFFKRELVG